MTSDELTLIILCAIVGITAVAIGWFLWMKISVSGL